MNFIESSSSSTKTKFDWNDRIRKVLENSPQHSIDFDQLRKEIIKQYRQVKPHSDRTTTELTKILNSHLAQSTFITRLGNEIFYLYYLPKDPNEK